MNNYERIQQMTIEQMSNFLCKFNGCCEGCMFYMEEYCCEQLDKWLLSEVEE